MSCAVARALPDAALHGASGPLPEDEVPCEQSLSQRVRVCARPLRELGSPSTLLHAASTIASSASTIGPAAKLRFVQQGAEDRGQEVHSLRTAARCFVSDSLRLVSRADADGMRSVLVSVRKAIERAGRFKDRVLADVRELDALLNGDCSSRPEVEAVLASLGHQHEEADSLYSLFLSVQENLSEELGQCHKSSQDISVALPDMNSPGFDELDFCSLDGRERPGRQHSQQQSPKGKDTESGSVCTGLLHVEDNAVEVFAQVVCADEKVQVPAERSLKVADAAGVAPLSEHGEDQPHMLQAVLLCEATAGGADDLDCGLQLALCSPGFGEAPAVSGTDPSDELALGLHSPGFEQVSGLELSPLGRSESLADSGVPELGIEVAQAAKGTVEAEELLAIAVDELEPAPQPLAAEDGESCAALSLPCMREASLGFEFGLHSPGLDFGDGGLAYDVSSPTHSEGGDNAAAAGVACTEGLYIGIADCLVPETAEEPAAADPSTQPLATQDTACAAAEASTSPVAAGAAADPVAPVVVAPAAERPRAVEAPPAAEAPPVAEAPPAAEVPTEVVARVAAEPAAEGAPAAEAPAADQAGLPPGFDVSQAAEVRDFSQPAAVPAPSAAEPTAAAAPTVAPEPTAAPAPACGPKPVEPTAAGMGARAEAGGGLPVQLHVYDVSRHSSVQWINTVLANRYSPVKFGGFFHVGVEVDGKEWSFGHCPVGTGVAWAAPRTQAAHNFRETLKLPASKLTASEVQAVVRTLQAEYVGCSYNLFHRNCCHFADDLCQRLGVGQIPPWVYRLASLGGGAVQALGGLDEQVGVLQLSRSSAGGAGAALLAAARQQPAALPAQPAALPAPPAATGEPKRDGVPL